MKQMLIAHGSKHPAHRKAFDELLRRYLEFSGEKDLHYGFLDYIEPNAEKVLLQLVENSESVLIVPLFLGRARHLLEDIPCLVEKAKKHAPKCKLFQSEALGKASDLIPALQMNIERVLEKESWPAQEAMLILLGRGSSIRSSTKFIFEIEKGLFLPFAARHVGFWTAAEPNFDVVLEQFVLSESKKLIIQPLFLFPGILFDKLKQKIKTRMKLTPEKQVVLCQPLCELSSLPQLLAARMRVISQQ